MHPGGRARRGPGARNRIGLLVLPVTRRNLRGAVSFRKSQPEWNICGNAAPTMSEASRNQEKSLAQAAMAAARRNGWCLATAESCSAGMIATLLSQVDGAASCFHGGIVTYSKEMKHALLGVPADLLAEKGAVCSEVAQAMASGALVRTPADAAIAITGVAGPEPDPDGNPVGLVFVAVATPREVATRRLDLGRAPREEVLSRAIRAALELFIENCRERAA
jgi:PncC family amidohydrolase